MAAIDCDPFCPVCGGPFSHVRLQHFSQPKEEEGYLINAAYNIEILSAAQTSVSSGCGLSPFAESALNPIM